MTTHSDKARATLAAMNTQASDWHMAEIVWRKELRRVPTKIKCRSCKGTGRAFLRRSDSAYICAPYDSCAHVKAFLKTKGDPRAEASYFSTTPADRRAWLEAEGIGEAQCPTCPARRKWNGYGTGEVIALVEREVEVGYIQWPDGCRFDSRYQYSDGRSLTHCALCSKGINQSGRVPVVGQDATGQWHGMFVGEDCARKFMSFERFKKDSFISDNLSAETEAA